MCGENDFTEKTVVMMHSSATGAAPFDAGVMINSFPGELLRSGMANDLCASTYVTELIQGRV